MTRKKTACIPTKCNTPGVWKDLLVYRCPVTSAPQQQYSGDGNRSGKALAQNSTIRYRELKLKQMKSRQILNFKNK